MKKTLTLLLSTSALAAALALPASGSFLASGDDRPAASADRSADAQPAKTRVLASNDDYGDDDDDWEDDDDDHDDHDHDDHDDDDDDDDDDEGGRRSAPVGSTTPPDNGLFGTGDKPAVKVK